MVGRTFQNAGLAPAPILRVFSGVCLHSCRRAPRVIITYLLALENNKFGSGPLEPMDFLLKGGQPGPWPASPRANTQLQRALRAPTPVPPRPHPRLPQACALTSAPSSSRPWLLHSCFLIPASWAGPGFPLRAGGPLGPGLPPPCLPLENPEPGGQTGADACGATCPPPGVSPDSCGHD